MAIIPTVRLRDILLLAWQGVWYGQNPAYVLDLQGLIDLTVPSDWTPPVATVADWEANAAVVGNDLNYLKAEEITNTVNGVPTS